MHARLLSLSLAALPACASAPPPEPTPPLGMVSAGELTPPATACDLVRPLPAIGEVATYAQGLAEVGVTAPPSGPKGDVPCSADALDCRGHGVSVFASGDAQVHWVGFDAEDGRRHLVKDDAPEDGTCGVSPPAFDALSTGPLHALQRTFGDCQSGETLRDWLVFDAAQASLVAALSCQGADGRVVLEPDGRLRLVCLGKTFVVTPDALSACWAG